MPPSRKKKGGSPMMEMVMRNKLGFAILFAIFGFCVMLYFSPQHTDKQGKAVDNMDTTTGQFATMADEARTELRKSGYLRSEARQQQTDLYKSFTPWQRQFCIQQTISYLNDFDFADTVSKVLKAPNMARIFSGATPDLHSKAITEDEDAIWKLLDAFVDGTYNDAAVMGEEAVDSIDASIKTGFWGGMDIFSEEETKYYSTKAWYGVREVFLGRFFKSWSDTMKGKVAIKQRRGDFEWPDEPEKEKTWADEEGSGDVEHLDDGNFDSALSSRKHSIVMFYAPWCGHCKSFKPEFQSAATAITNTDVVLAGVDCTGTGKKVCKKYGVSGYPTILYFLDGVKHADYDGGRTKFGIIDWLNNEERLDGALNDLVEELRPPPEVQWSDEKDAQDIEHMTDGNFDDTISSKGHALVMFYAPWCGHCKAFKPDYAASATSLKNSDVVIGAVDATKHTKKAKSLGVEGYPTIWYFKEGKKIEKYSGARTLAGVTSWLSGANRMGDSLKSEL